MLITNDLEIYERALAFGHYERYDSRIQTQSLKPFAGLPLGGFKNRMHQLSAAVGRVQLKHFDQRSAEVRRAMNFFWDYLEGLPGISRRGQSLPIDIEGVSPCLLTSRKKSDRIPTFRERIGWNLRADSGSKISDNSCASRSSR
jgi:dTDP-4-amino-4,6-dideoxygalactose transaminase